MLATEQYRLAHRKSDLRLSTMTKQRQIDGEGNSAPNSYPISW